jgi:hypothetical protein
MYPTILLHPALGKKVIPIPHQIQYYWYTYLDDTYNDHRSLYAEINEM